MKAKSETTHGFGRYHVNSLVRIRARDERGPPMNTTERIPVWSSVRGKYTPWITYRGTYIRERERERFHKIFHCWYFLTCTLLHYI